MKSLEERFWEKVDKSGNCWEWTAGTNGVGYGIIWSGVRRECAHRVSWEFAHGTIPKGKWILHRCDNPGCVNPEHLFLGDSTANVRDMHRKGRGWGGIGPDTAYAVLWMRASGFSRKRIMEEYGVSLDTIKHIIIRRNWKSLQQLHD
jgi:hypothetical protein